MRQRGIGTAGVIIAMVIAGLIVYGIIYYGPEILERIQSGKQSGPTIKDLATDPLKYNNQEVDVIGTFTVISYPLTYKVTDGTYSLTIKIEYGYTEIDPSPAEKVRVQGTFIAAEIAIRAKRVIGVRS